MSGTWKVDGISCGHCKAAIESEVGALDGVDTVLVDIDTKTVVVTGAVGDDAVVAAIDEAGYEGAVRV